MFCQTFFYFNELQIGLRFYRPEFRCNIHGRDTKRRMFQEDCIIKIISIMLLEPDSIFLRYRRQGFARS